jgi:integrase
MAHSKDRDGIQTLGRQHYRVVVELTPDPATGVRRRKHRTVRGPRTDAVAVRTEQLAKMNAGQLVGSADQRLDAYLRSWLEARRGTVSDRSWQRYDSLMRSAIIPALGAVKVGKLTPQHLRDYFASCRMEPSPRSKGPDEEHPDRVQARISPTTVHHRYVVLKAALEQARRDHIIIENPMDQVAPPKRMRQQPQIIGEDQAGELVRAAEGTPAEVVVWLAYHTGARLGELLALRWRDVDFATRTIHICRALVEPMRASDAPRWFAFKEPKSGQGRSIDVGDVTLARLKRHRAEQKAHRLSLPAEAGWCDLDLVFPNMWHLKGVEPGEPMRPSTVSRVFRSLADTAGHEGVRFHDLRHAHATVLLRQGEPPHLVSRRLGHADVALTLRVYSHVLPGQERDAVDRFEAGFRRAMGGGENT